MRQIPPHLSISTFKEGDYAKLNYMGLGGALGVKFPGSGPLGVRFEIEHVVTYDSSDFRSIDDSVQLNFGITFSTGGAPN